MINYQLYPRSNAMPYELLEVIACFEAALSNIDSANNKLVSNAALAYLEPHLRNIGYIVETGKTTDQKINVPVLFGLNNSIDKSFDADAVSQDGSVVVEVEAGRALTNYQFLKDIFQACMMHDVKYLVLAVRNDYRGRNDFKKISAFLETLYISNRLQLPLEGILLVGY